MYKHPHFDLLLHDNRELEQYIHGSVYQRVTLHEWPLSCVQRVVHYDARRYIYKAQSEPTVEAEFYAAARSKLLVGARTLYREGPYACLLLEHLEAPRLEDLHLGEEEAQVATRLILDEIAHIAPARARQALSHYLDLSTPKKWAGLVKATQARLEALVEAGTFCQVSRAAARDLENWASIPAVLNLYAGPVGLAHGDLTGDNVFVLQDGSYRVIDWQRPILAPAAVDRVALLQSLGCDAAKHTSEGALRMRNFLLIHWCVECARRWFPPGSATYDRMVAGLLV
jgi:hypothetical protein